MSIRGNKGPEADERRELAEGNAAIRRDTNRRATAGAETVIDAEDSSGNPIADTSPLSFEEREANKAKVENG